MSATPSVDLDPMAYATGFTFAEDLTAFPPANRDRRDSRSPAQRTLYIGQQGASLNTSKGKLIVSYKDQEILSIPLKHVGRLVLFGAISLSTGARNHALYEKLPVVFLTRRGRYLGQLDSSSATGTALRRIQYAASDNYDERLSVARKIVAGKISNQRALVKRYSNPSEKPPALARLAEFKTLAETAPKIDQLLGLEGAAAKEYFAAFREVLPPGWEFPGRRRRPATDLINAMLSYGYACLTGEAVGALAAVGLDPGIGLLHADANRPSLALDLIEEFRPLIVDTVVLNCIRRNIISPTDADILDDEPGIMLSDSARQAFLTQLEERMLTPFTAATIRVSYRRALHLQARQLSIVLRTGPLTATDSPGYQPIAWR